MDAIDRKILAVLQKDASLSVDRNRQPGWTVSSDAVLEAHPETEADGVIQRRVAVVDQDKLGLGVTLFVFVSVGELAIILISG